MSEAVSLELLGQQMLQLQADIRAIKRDIAMLRAQQSELPTVAQLQAGLTARGERVAELFGDLTRRLEAMLAEIKSIMTRH